ncbi:MAG: lactate utilization protein [Planctomycetaceae bacterium]|jgi:L-lactate dehydrogenase complex protein LldG|nr:lactate utilization protein [Planctomycetaceae bacterium]
MSSTRMGDARETILARVREALRLPAPPPHLQSPALDPAPTGSLPVLPLEAARPWLPDGGDSPEESRRILGENLARLKAELHHVADAAAAAAFLADLARGRNWKRVATHGHPLVATAAATLACDTERVDAGPFDKDALEACDAGVTSCEVLVAQTGSVLVSSATCGGRALSVLPHVHVVVATADQVVPTLGDALHAVRERHAGRLPSMLSFITGPSRTGDIERILVLGAHGPKELIVLLVG